jgi:hemerythrin-like domain-containing protein
MQNATHAEGSERRTDARERPTNLAVLGERLRLEHAILRTALEGLARALPRPTARPDPRSTLMLRSAAWELYLTLVSHLEFEETFVAPVVRDHDAWGEERVTRMICEHNEQRRMVRELVEDNESDMKSIGELVTAARAVIAALEVDMRSEERLLARVLDGSSVVEDQQDG